MKKIILILILGIISVFAIKYFDWAFLTKDFVIYPVECEKKLAEGSCNVTSTPLDMMIFRISRADKDISLWEENAVTPTASYKGCMIRSYYNWSCRDPEDEERTFGFTRGSYWQDPPDEHTYYVTKKEWLKLKCGDCSLPELIIFILKT